MKKKKPSLDKKIQQVNQLKSQLARALADYDNLTKRVEKEKTSWLKLASFRLVEKLLPILDNLEAAENHLKDRGLTLALEEFRDVLKEEGLVEILAKVGDSFDPEVHEVVELVSGGETGRVAELVLPGWRFEEGPVVRFAKVKVYGDKIPKEEELDKEMLRGEYA